uniref:Synaptopodin 2 n=1 Tax=Oryzias latipes TaxID=8090 RepID=A0A3P9HVF7_ORYLA
MGTGDYVCVTLSGAAPWGFSLAEGEGDNQRSFLVSQVEQRGRAFLAGIQDGDVVVSINGKPCADLTLLRASALIDTSTDSLQLCLKRNVFIPAERLESEGRSLSSEVLESTTLNIFSPDHRFQLPKELYISESRHEADLGHSENDTDSPKTLQLCSVQQDTSSCDNQGSNHEEGAEWSVSPGDILELQVSLSKQTLSDAGSTALGSAHGIEGEFSKREVIKALHKTTATSLCTPCPIREPLGQHGVVVTPTSMLGQVEVILQQPTASGAGRGILSVGGPKVSESLGSQSERQEGGGISEGVPGSFTISFKTPSEEASGEEQGSDSEGDQEKPSKHHARHARLRRKDSISEKQLKEAKSKCKRIALLLTAAPSNPNNKGVLMFKKHRQRAKKYTLVSYGTGEDEQEYSDEEDEENGDTKQEIPAAEITFLSTINSATDKTFIRDATSSKCVLNFNLDKALMDIEQNLQNQAEMECLPETKGKGALMFAQRRLRMDEISAEHEELRRQGMPVEAVQETNKRAADLSYMQSATEGRTYMDVNIHQQSQQQYQQYQEQQYYEQQQNYQQQHQYQQFQQQQYEQSQYQQQQMYQQQQQQYLQEQKQMQQYPAIINGTNQQQANEIQSSFNNLFAKPFAAENMVATPYSHGVSGTIQDLAAQGEQIASRDERISTPAIKTSFLQDARRRNTGKPMFTFKEAPKMSPNPELLNLLNRSDKKLGFESGPEEDYLSLGAEACNFLQSQRVKPKIPPPVAPKPVINPNSPPWSPQIEAANQNMPHCAKNSISTPAVAPTKNTAPTPELEPTTAPAVEHPPPLAPHETPANAITDKQHAWPPTETESQQQPLQVTLPEENIEMKPCLQAESSQKTTWIAEQAQTQQQSPAGWHPPQVKEPPSGQTPTQPSWVTHQPAQSQAQPQTPTSTWTPQSQPNWSHPQGQNQSQPQPPWIQPQEEPQSQQQHQVQSSWAQTNEQQQSQQIQPAWLQTQEHPQQQAQNQWTHLSQVDSQQQAPWVQQPQQKVQPPWAQQVQQEPQPQPPWVQQPQHQALQQSWAQPQASHQHQQTWVSGQPQQQPSVDAWGQSQIQVQVQPPWIQAAQPPSQPQTHPQPQPQPQANLNPWAPVPAQAQSQSQWAQHPLENNQHHMNSWNQEQNQPQHQPPWVQKPPTQSTPYPGWQQQISSTPPQPQGDTWAPAQTQLQTNVDSWTSQSQQTSTNVSVSKTNNRPSPKPWQPLQNTSQNLATPPPPRRMQSFTIGQRPLPINPMATVLNPKSSPGSAFEMPVVKGKGADMFAKRQSRMEKFVVDSDTVEANKASRSTSPAASLPNEWKYTSNVRAPPPRAYNPIQSPLYPPAASKQPPAASPSTKAKKKDQEKQTPAPKPLNVIDVMKHQPYQLDSSLFIFGPGAEAVKPPISKPSPPNPPNENQPITYGQTAPVQQTGPYSSPYPQQAFGMPMQPPMHDSLYQQAQANVYPYQQPSGGQYPQQYNQQYQQPAQPSYHPQSPQPSNSPYSQPLQASYQPANSPPYMAPPPVPYEQQSTSCYIAPSFPVVGRADSVSGGSNAAAPRPKFTANKSSAQVWKPAVAEKE